MRAGTSDASSTQAPQDLRTALSFEELCRRLGDEMVRQGLMFPEIYRAFRWYVEHVRDKTALLRLQTERLATLLDHAKGRVPAYRECPPADRDDPFATLRGFPLVDKRELRDRLVDHCDDEIDPAKCRYTLTSGTTGIPLKIIWDRSHLMHVYALTMVRNARYGLPFDRKVVRPYELWLEDWFEYTSPAFGFARIAEFGVADGADEGHMMTRVREFRPDVIRAHPSRLLRISRGLADMPPRPSAILSYGESLTPAARRMLAQRFDAPVFDLYGMREVYTIAAQCRAGGYHIDAERLWVEVVDEQGVAVPDGTVGEIVVTNLTNLAMPFIRYRTGDVGALGTDPCNCGQPHKLMRLVEGRDPGFIRLADGSTIESLRLARLLRGLPVEQFQIVQTDPAGLNILVKPLPGFIDTEVEQQARTLLGSRLAIQVTPVDDGEFVATERRKMVDFVSRLPVTPHDEARG